MLFHSIGHGIRADTKTGKSCSVPKPGVHANEQSEEDVETIRRWWKHDAWNLYVTMELFETTGAGSYQLTLGSLCSIRVFLSVLSARNQFCGKRILGACHSNAVSLT